MTDLFLSLQLIFSSKIIFQVSKIIKKENNSHVVLYNFYTHSVKLLFICEERLLATVIHIIYCSISHLFHIVVYIIFGKAFFCFSLIVFLHTNACNGFQLYSNRCTALLKFSFKWCIFVKFHIFYLVLYFC